MLSEPATGNSRRCHVAPPDGIEPGAETFRQQDESDSHQARQGADQQRQDQENLFFPVGEQCVPVAGRGFPPAGVILFRGLRHLLAVLRAPTILIIAQLGLGQILRSCACVPSRVLNRRAVSSSHWS